MNSAAFSAEQGPGTEIRYRCFRALVRFGLALRFRHIRILQAERVSLDGPTILLVNQPARWLDVLILVAAFEERIVCLVDRRILDRWQGRALAWAFQMAAFDSAGDSSAALRACKNSLRAEEIVAVFAGAETIEGRGSGWRFASAATLAIEAESEYSEQLGVAIVPIHLLLPPSWGGEVLIHAGEPLFAQDYLALPAEPVAAPTAQLEAALECSCRDNPFSLQPDNFSRFLADLEQVMREDLEEDWAARPNWKQTVEGFQLSGFVEAWCERLNQSDPARLVRLRKALDAYRQARRRWSLREAKGEGGAGLAPVLRRLRLWIESVLGFPVALYGLINHLAAGLVLWAVGLFEPQDRRSKVERWFLRVAIVLAGYAGEIAIVSQWLGRSAAGYYAVTLPLSGAYLARYVWLWTRRARFLLRDFNVPGDQRQLRRMRKRLLVKFDAARDADAPVTGATPAAETTPGRRQD